MSRQWIRWGIAASAACCAVMLSWSIANSQNYKPAGKADLPRSNKEATKTLGGPDRYLTSVSTDKPIYRAGEKVYVRGVLLNAANHKPLPAGQSANPTIEIKGPKGDVVSSGSSQARDSVWGFAWDVPPGQAGGEYTAHITYPWDGHAPAERKFEIRAYRAPRLKSQITFLRDGYAPGDKVTASLDVKRAEGGVPEGAKVTVTARVDGMEVKGPAGKVDSRGLCTVTFDLPREIPRGEGTLALVVEDGGVVETASKTIPILLQTVDLQLFPEGGDLIAGYSNRVYLQARQPNGKPADLAGKVMLKQAIMPVEVAHFRTEHEGRGRLEFTPEAGKDYFVSITEPAGIKKQYPLPSVRTDGAVIHSESDTFAKNEPVTLKVGCTSQNYRVTLSRHEVEIAAYKAETSQHRGKAGAIYPISFDLPPDVDGVLTATVWNEKNAPLAERLIFRQPAKPINISVSADKKNYVPGDKAGLTIKTTDENGKPVSAVVGLTVTDDSVLEMVEKREQAPRLPVMVFLEPEVKDLADAHVYLDSKNPRAPLAVDLLLGTQGWRRFALMNLAKFIEENGDQARRAVALKIQSRMELDKDGGFADDMMAGAPPLPIPKHGAWRVARGGDLQIIDNAPQILDFRKAMPAPAAQKEEAAKRPMANRQMDAEQAGEKLQEAIMQAGAKEKKMMFAPGRAAGLRAMNAMVLVREFAHQVRPDRKPTDRIDFSETLYWNAGVKTDENGKAVISFGLNDSVTTFRIFADGFTTGGAVGTGSSAIESVQPFYAEAKLPLEITEGDKILLPISLINATENSLPDAAVSVDLKGDFKLADLLKDKSELGAGKRIRWIQPITVGTVNGAREFSLTAKAGPYEDKVTRQLSVKPKGFPIEVAFGGILEPDKAAVHNISIPKNVVPGSLASNTAVYPTPLANLTEALQRMIQDPYGCFEQTSSTSYPLTMAQQYFLSHTGVDPKLVETARQKLDAGYKRLVGFWCPDRGYEWFGENPGHEALTAFGLLHFSDMTKVREVDQNMIASTRSWLYKQKDGKGGFTRKRRALHTWIEDKDASNAYILWSLLESGQPAADLKPELASLKTAAAETQNNYVVALAANALYLSGDKQEAKKLMDRLVSKQKSDGSVEGIKCSIVGSGGESLEVEGTSLSTLAWLRDPAYAGSVEKSIKFLADSCKSGRYGSTQATVLALRAIVNYDKQRARPKAPGKVRLYVDGQSIGDWADFSPSTEGAIKLPDLSELLTPGEHKLELRMEGGAPMPYSLSVKYNALTPASSQECKLDLNVKLAQDRVIEGAATEANVTVVNKSKEVLPTPVAIIGLPGGLEPRHDQLKELVKKGKIDAYEVLGRDVVLYWRTLPGEAKVEVPLSLIAAVPGTYTGPASRAYLYYTDEYKKWVDGTKVEIAAK